MSPGFLPTILGRGELTTPDDLDPGERGFVKRLLSGRAWITPGHPYYQRWDTERYVQDGFERVIWVWRGIDAIARSASRLTIRSIPMDQVDETDKRFTDDPCLKMLNRRANPHETARQARYRLSALTLLSKKGVFLEVQRSRAGKPVRWSILPIDRTSPIPADVERPDWDGRVLDGFETFTANGERRVLPEYKHDKTDANSVIWVRLPHPTDPLMGTTPLEAAGISIDLDYWARIYNRNFMATDGRPGGVLAVQGRMSEPEAEELRVRFSGGPQAPGHTSVIEADAVSWVDTATNPRDAQYVEGRKVTKDDILEALGVPETVVGNASGRTYDNADAERAVFWEETMLNHLELIATCLEPLTVGGDEDGDQLWHDVSKVGPLQYAKEMDRKNRLEELDKGAITIDEYRTATGREPIGAPGAKVLWVANQKIAVGEDADQQAAAELRAAGQGKETDPVEQSRQLAAVGRENERMRIADPVLPSPPGTPGPDTNAPGDAPGTGAHRVARPGEATAPGGMRGSGTDAPVRQPPPGTHLVAVKDALAAQTGVMVALHPTPAQAAQLRDLLPAMPGADPEPVGMYHVTVAYLGQLGVDVTPQQVTTAAAALEQAVAETYPLSLQARVSTLATWGAGDREAVVALIDCPGLDALRAATVQRLSAAGVPVRTEHGYSPHLTVAYAPMGWDLPAGADAAVRSWSGELNRLGLTAAHSTALLDLRREPRDAIRVTATKVVDEPEPLELEAKGVPRPTAHGGWIWAGRPGTFRSVGSFHHASHHLTDRQIRMFVTHPHDDPEMVDLADRVHADDQLDPIDLNRLGNFFRAAGAGRSADYLDRMAREAHQPGERAARGGYDPDQPERHETGQLERIPGGYAYGHYDIRKQGDRLHVLPESAHDPFSEETDFGQSLSSHPDLASAQRWIDEHPRERRQGGTTDDREVHMPPSPYEAAFPEVRPRDDNRPDDVEDAPQRISEERRQALDEAEAAGRSDELAALVREMRAADPALSLDAAVVDAWASIKAGGGAGPKV